MDSYRLVPCPAAPGWRLGRYLGMEDALSSTVQVDGFEVTASSAAAEDMVKGLTSSKDKPAPVIKSDRGVEFEKSAAAVELGKKGGEASAKAREERAKEAAKEARTAPPELPDEPEAAKGAEKAQEGEEKPEKPSPKDRDRDPQVRIRQLAAEKNALADRLARQEAEFAARLERLERSRTAPEPQERREEPQKANPASDEPVLDQFESYEDWIKAHTRWEVKQELAEERKRAEAERYTRERQDTANKRQETFREKVKDRAAEWADMDDRLISMMRDAPPIMELSGSDEVGPANYITEAITQSEDPTGFARYLSENEQVVVSLLQASPWELPMKLGKIEARFAKEAQAEREAAPEQRKPAVPPPFKPLQPTAAGPDEDSQSFEAVAAKRLKGVRRGLKG